MQHCLIGRAEVKPLTHPISFRYVVIAQRRTLYGGIEWQGGISIGSDGPLQGLLLPPWQVMEAHESGPCSTTWWTVLDCLDWTTTIKCRRLVTLPQRAETRRTRDKGSRSKAVRKSFLSKEALSRSHAARALVDTALLHFPFEAGMNSFFFLLLRVLL